ncbi:fatty acid desaturase family protein [Pseudonocardia bannensis]|uniref:Acyl-CoA desaturase n=1 Tax=Pseudonocardia bannensis TaxID=630973 RepID=A0A848DK22_9PSEU|nr:acyl-CoA desaturase [Pseudonocardia bannensis]NMH92876.1 acyl-CoA desaturase [Pseudonocardia bannensis]
MSTSAAAHLTDEQIEAFGAELDAIRAEVVGSLGEEDAAYIRRVVTVQRGLEAGGRGLLLFSGFPPAWLAGTATLAVAKILENMELGHNILHGQWDWMRDPEIHSTTWEWDHASPAEFWKKSHNFEHHTFTNVRGKDRDLGYAIMRVTPEQPWKPIYLLQPLYNMGLAAIFEWGIAIYDIELEKVAEGTKPWSAARSQIGAIWRKARKQLAKDYVLFPLLSGPNALSTLTANATANLVRNVWSHAVIFCGHFPDGTETFDESRLDGETRGQWYLRQLLGSANLTGGPVFHIMTGNLSHQIEHHLFPDVPSNHYARIAPRVREICERYGLPYTAGSLPKQYGTVLRKLARLALPGGGPAPQAPQPVAPPRPVPTDGIDTVIVRLPAPDRQPARASS